MYLTISAYLFNEIVSFPLCGRGVCRKATSLLVTKTTKEERKENNMPRKIRYPKKKGNMANIEAHKIKTAEQARELGRRGGLRSQEVQKERKLLSRHYAEFIAKSHKLKLNKKEVELKPDEFFEVVITKLLTQSQQPSAAVAMMRELREGSGDMIGTGAEHAKKDADLLGSLLGNSREEKEDAE